MHGIPFHDLGARLAAWIASWRRVFEFGARALVMAASPSAYDATTRNVMAKQIYFTAWQILPGFVLVCALLCYVVIRIVVSTAVQYGLSDYGLSMVLRLLVLELIPVFVALFVALRSGAAINTEVTLMHIRGDLEALQARGDDPMRHELVPRVVGSAVSVVALTVLGGTIALLLAYFALYGFSPWGLTEYTRAIGQTFDPTVTLGLGLKALFFGLAVAVIPITASLEASREIRLAPIAVLNGMVRLFLTLTMIEGASLAAKYI
ncbi:MAG: ABC transporter permease [Betaproteobacteria bacterium]|nr:ABC transporter permease [Betaproteobacteria bacterium]